MKARDLQKMGFEMFIDRKGEAVWAKPLAKIGADAAQAVSLPQLLALEKADLEKHQKALNDITGPTPA